MQVEILSTQGSKSFGVLKNVLPSTSVRDLKVQLGALNKSLPASRQSLRLEPKGKALKDDQTLGSLNLPTNCHLFVKDLGPQIGWKTVFLAEYAGPLLVYLWLYQRPWIFYGTGATSLPTHQVVHIAAVCWMVHYAKRLVETLFVHRFSHATMPLLNLFKNCGYYWLFTAYVAYHVNHPLYTPPSTLQMYLGLAGFTLCELGNLSIHVALRNLRPAGTTTRKLPLATANPFTLLFNLVSCPNYTYEVGSWLFFTIMTQCLPAGLFALAGFYQMAVWALGKHKAYKHEFPHYPRNRKAILPYIL